MKLPKLNPIKVVRFTGDRKSAITSSGKAVYRTDKLWMGRDYGWVHCSGYGSNFLYHDPDMDQQTGEWPKGRKYIGRISPLCSCGAPGVVTGANAYKGDASPTNSKESTTPGMAIVCLSVLNTGKHLNGSTD
jgi:hypothetical protein